MDPFSTDASHVLSGRSLLRSGRNDRALRRAVDSGELVAVRPGYFVPADEWEGLDLRERHVLRATTYRDSLSTGVRVLSHRTAAAIHGFDLLGDWPDVIEMTDAGAARTRRSSMTWVHALRLSGLDVGVAAGLPLSRPARTAVDLVATLPFRDAVVALDSVLPSTDRRRRKACLVRPGEFDEALARRLPVRGHNHVARVRAFADGESGSPGESLSRVCIHELGMPAPILQKSFFRGREHIGTVDFWWPEAGLIGEFDGHAKYSRAKYRGGLTPADVVVREKRREDALRALPEVRGFERWMWSDLHKPGALASILARLAR